MTEKIRPRDIRVGELFERKFGKSVLSLETFKAAQEWAERRVTFEAQTEGLMNYFGSLVGQYEKTPPLALLRDVVACTLAEPPQVTLGRLQRLRQNHNVGMYSVTQSIHELVGLKVIEPLSDKRETYYGPTQHCLMAVVERSEDLGFLTDAARKINPTFEVESLRSLIQLDNLEVLDTTPLQTSL